MGMFEDMFKIGFEAVKIVTLPVRLIDPNASILPTITTDYQEDYPEDKRDYQKDE